MGWELQKPKFKIGDLVRVTETISFIIGDIAKEGDLGLVTESEFDGETILTMWGFDYLVLLKDGNTFVFFESELELVEPKNKKEVKFVFMKN